MKPHEGTRANRASVVGAVRWYFDEVRVAGVPLYCNPTRIGAFAVEADKLATGTDDAIFQLFVTLAMY